MKNKAFLFVVSLASSLCVSQFASAAVLKANCVRANSEGANDVVSVTVSDDLKSAVVSKLSDASGAQGGLSDITLDCVKDKNTAALKCSNTPIPSRAIGATTSIFKMTADGKMTFQAVNGSVGSDAQYVCTQAVN